MSNGSEGLAQRLHQALVEEIRSRRPDYLEQPFTVAEIYQELVPYRSHRDRIGAAMNGDYEHALLRLLTGEGDYLVLESEPARRRMTEELKSPNPNTAVIREFAALDVRLNPARISKPAPPPGPAAASTVAPPPAPANGGSNGGAAPAAKGSVPAGPKAEAPPPRVVPAESLAPTPVPKDAPAAAGEGANSTCRWCREELPLRETLHFCPFCGTDIKLVPCAECGEELEPTWRFCIACGAQVSTGD